MSRAHIGDDELVPQGSPRAVIVLVDKARTEHPLGEATFLAPQFLTVADRSTLTLDGGGFVVVHKQSLDDNAPLLATAMGKDGKKRWSCSLDGSSVVASALERGQVIIVVKGSRKGASVVALSAATGEQMWKYGT